MSTTNTHSPNFEGSRQSESKTFNNQRQTIFQYLKIHTATASMVSDATGVPQKSICRYKRDLEKKGLATTQSMIDATPLGRFAKTSEQAEVIFFLGSPKASFITGQTIVVDGGATLDIRI
jgi:enoyl-[acyl-carrier-protein] reductase (NADH)